MRNLLLSVALIAVPVGVFAAVESVLPPAQPETSQSQSPSDALGDLTRYKKIVSDVKDIADTGDLKAAETRVTDFETLWDAEEPTLRPKAPAVWGQIDGAADDAFAALRAKSPSQAKVDAALATLNKILKGEAGAPQSSGGVEKVAGIAVTDTGGHPIPCEDLLGKLRAAKPASDKDVAAKVDDYRTKGTERCNADDDSRADAFFAQGLALLTK